MPSGAGKCRRLYSFRLPSLNYGTDARQSRAGFFYILDVQGAVGYAEAIENISIQHLELLGRGYVIEHCVSFFRKKNEELAYRIYVTDALKAIAENTQKMFGGSFMQKRFAEIIRPKDTAEDIEDADIKAKDIIERIKAKAEKLGG